MLDQLPNHLNILQDGSLGILILQLSRQGHHLVGLMLMFNTDPTPSTSTLVVENVGIGITLQDTSFPQPMYKLGQENVRFDAVDLRCHLRLH